MIHVLSWREELCMTILPLLLWDEGLTSTALQCFGFFSSFEQEVYFHRCFHNLRLEILVNEKWLQFCSAGWVSVCIEFDVPFWQKRAFPHLDKVHCVSHLDLGPPMLYSPYRAALSYGWKQILVTVGFVVWQAFYWLSQTTCALVMGAVEAVINVITILRLKSSLVF